MPTNLEIDDRLLAQAQKLGGHKTKKATVNEAGAPGQADWGEGWEVIEGPTLTVSETAVLVAVEQV